MQDLLENEGHTRIRAIENIWEQVTEYFEYFNDWFQNRTLFHFIGFLIATRSYQTIDSLILKSKTLSKKQFERFLKSEISKMILINKKRTDSDGNEYQVQLENLNYENEDQKTNDKSEINRILLLHNVYTTMRSEKEKARFPFNLYKQTKRNEKWSLEHIHAQNSESINKRVNQNSWLDDHIKSLSSQNNSDFEELITRMQVLRNADEIEKDDFEKMVSDIYATVNNISEAKELNVHSISNLCLVDANTNSQLNNSVFDVKREIIKQRELSGFYIPICTRNVFLKAYTEYPTNNAYWTQNDREDYLKNIKNTYEYFVNTLNN